jgi:isopentenyldiphosphate isomerase
LFNAPEEEVEDVKWIHYKLLKEQVANHEPSLVPMDALIHGDYKRFFEMLEAKYH